MRSIPYQGQILEALRRSPGQRIESVRTLVEKVAGTQPSPNGDLEVAREVSLNAELLALAGSILIHRSDGSAVFELTPAGRANLPKSAVASLLPKLRLPGRIGSFNCAL